MVSAQPHPKWCAIKLNDPQTVKGIWEDDDFTGHCAFMLGAHLSVTLTKHGRSLLVSLLQCFFDSIQACPHALIFVGISPCARRFFTCSFQQLCSSRLTERQTDTRVLKMSSCSAAKVESASAVVGSCTEPYICGWEGTRTNIGHVVDDVC